MSMRTEKTVIAGIRRIGQAISPSVPEPALAGLLAGHVAAERVRPSGA